MKTPTFADHSRRTSTQRPHAYDPRRVRCLARYIRPYFGPARSEAVTQEAIGGGYKGVLDIANKKPFFELLHLKIYLTFDVLGALFAKPRGRNCESIHLLLPLLKEALGIVIEHPIGGMKHYGAKSQVLRHRIGRFDDQVAVVSAGLSNHHLATQAANPNWVIPSMSSLAFYRFDH